MNSPEIIKSVIKAVAGMSDIKLESKEMSGSGSLFKREKNCQENKDKD